jgi:hypothetical protein
MVIKKGEPWLLWPNISSYDINTGNISETFEGNTDFTLAINLMAISPKSSKRTLFAKLPNYCGVDIEENDTPLLILNLLKNGKEIYKYLPSQTVISEGFNILVYRYNRLNKTLEVLVNEKIAISYRLEEDEELSVGSDPHIIFGSGNFPKNNFNLNYFSFQTDFILIAKSYKTFSEIVKIKTDGIFDESVIGLYDFKKHTDYKIYDLSKNCNFIHKIL